MIGGRIRVRGLMGLAVVVAINLAMFRGAMSLLTLPAISTWLVLLNLALARLLVWHRPLGPAGYGFLVAGFVASLISLPCNNQPQILATYQNWQCPSHWRQIFSASSLCSSAGGARQNSCRSGRQASYYSHQC